MRLGIDASGGDHAPESIVQGALDALEFIEAELVLFGNEKEIRPLLKGKGIEVVHCEEKIENTDKAVDAIRRKVNSSLVKGCLALKQGEINGFLSAGSTGALLAGGLFRTGRIRGIDRPALVTLYPMQDGMGLLVDAGANADCKAKHLLDFGVMASFYAKEVLGIDNPRVGLVSNGDEEGKGNELVKQTYPLLKDSSLNFVGNVEARDIPKSKVDVIVTDGFTGNVILKLSEGLGESLTGMIKGVFLKNLLTKSFALIYKSGLKDFKKHLDYTEYGGAPMMGVDGYLVKAHGSSNAKAIKNAIIYLEKYVQSDIVKSIKAYLEETH